MRFKCLSATKHCPMTRPGPGPVSFGSGNQRDNSQATASQLIRNRSKDPQSFSLQISHFSFELEYNALLLGIC